MATAGWVLYSQHRLKATAMKKKASLQRLGMSVALKKGSPPTPWHLYVRDYGRGLADAKGTKRRPVRRRVNEYRVDSRPYGKQESEWTTVSRHKTKAAAAAKRKLLVNKYKGRGKKFRVVMLKNGVYRYLVMAVGLTLHTSSRMSMYRKIARR